MRRVIQIGAILAALAAAGPTAEADKLVIGSIAYSGVRIGAIDGMKITFRMPSGKPVTKSLLDVKLVNVTGMPSLNEAESLLAAGKAREAVALYEKATTSEMPVGTLGLKQLLVYRKLVAAKKAGMIFEATESWLKIMDANKGSALAIKLQPSDPKTKSPANDRAIALLKAKEDLPNKAYAVAANELQIKLLNLQGRTEEARKLAAKLAGRSDLGTEFLIKSKLAAAESYLKTGEADEAVKALQPIMKQCDHRNLPRALLLLGRAQLILGGKASGQEKHKLLCEAGLNFVRVAAFFGSSKADASEALYYAGRVNESLAKPNIKAAKKAYTEVIKRYKNTPAATRAQQALAALNEK